MNRRTLKTMAPRIKASKKARHRRAVAAAPRLTPLTIKFAPEIVSRLLREVAVRKSERAPNRSIQAVVTEGIEAVCRK